MTWYAVYDKATGALISTGSVIADPLPDELAVVVCVEDPDHSRWDPDFKDFLGPVLDDESTPDPNVGLEPEIEAAPELIEDKDDDSED